VVDTAAALLGKIAKITNTSSFVQEKSAELISAVIGPVFQTAGLPKASHNIVVQLLLLQQQQLSRTTTDGTSDPASHAAAGVFAFAATRPTRSTTGTASAVICRKGKKGELLAKAGINPKHIDKPDFFSDSPKILENIDGTLIECGDQCGKEERVIRAARVIVAEDWKKARHVFDCAAKLWDPLTVCA